MKIQQFDSREEWLDARLGRITGTRLGNLWSTRDKKYKKGFYELIAERVCLPANDENAMDRGIRLEEEAVARFAKEAKKKVNTDLVIWSREDNHNIALSPDAFMEKKVKGKRVIAEAVECKCLNSASHIEAYLTKKIPSDYEAQVLQYFIVNDDLKKLYFIFYDPRMPIDFFWIERTREELQEEIDTYLTIERQVLAEVAEIEKRLTFD